MAAEIEETLSESTNLIQSQGGVFEIEDRGILIFSKKALGRFPEDGEILALLRLQDEGKSLSEAQQQAAAESHKPNPLVTWFKSFTGENA